MATLSLWLVLIIVPSALGVASEPPMFKCSNGFVIPTHLVCDGVADCMDGEDEQQQNCALQTCSPLEFYCGDHPSSLARTRCILLSWKCDGHADCWNGRDEKFCQQEQCGFGQFRCNNSLCISSSYVCDRYNDCGDYSDENSSYCRDLLTSSSCTSTEFHCRAAPTGPQCIPLSWTCDGEMDCDDKSDESDYLCFGAPAPTCPLGTFNCTDSSSTQATCINWNRVCDGEPDCPNGKDERCPTVSSCPSGSFHCTEGNLCIREEWVCDGRLDCPDGSDEANCQMNCTADQFSCITGGCVSMHLRCNGKWDCRDGTDEYMCSSAKLLECAPHQFTCADGLQCIGASLMCNQSYYCADGSDEVFCRQAQRGPCQGLSGCDQFCINVSHTHTCGCNHGYHVNTTDRRTCIDIDECSQLPPVCSQLCTNKPGGYNCSCSPGYVLDRDSCRAQNTTSAYLLCAYRASIEKLNVTSSTHTTLIPNLNNAVALDYHYSRGYLFISDMTKSTILRSNLTLTPSRSVSPALQVTPIVSTEIGGADGIAVDWINDKIYWTDSQQKHIEVANLDGSKRLVLFANDLDKPRAIVVAPAQGLLFWTDWGSFHSISRASMDGTNRSTLHSQYLGWPNALTIDHTTQTIYWADALYHVIESSRLDGSNRWVVVSGSGVVQHPYGMAVFEDWIYWTDWSAGALMKHNKKGNGTSLVALPNLQLPLVVQAVHQAVQAPGKNPCAVNNGGCKYLCLLKEGGRYGCACPTGVLLDTDGRGCQDLNTFIVFTHNVGIRRVSLDVPELISVPLPIYNLSLAVGLAWDVPTDSLFWTDKLIYVANLNGSNQRPLINNNIGNAVALAVDWQTRKLYWTDSGLKRIEVSNLDGTNRRILISSGLDIPRGITVHPTAGYMFWTDWGSRPMIGRSGLDGSGRRDIANSSLKYINAVVIDFDTDTLYWADAYYSIIEMSDLDGQNRRTFLPNIVFPYGMALYGGYLYWTDWTNRRLERVNKTTGRDRLIVEQGINHMNAIQVVNRHRQPVSNPCAVNNGGCSHLCLTRPGQDGRAVVSCACPTGQKMVNNRTCDPQINNYLIIAAGSSIHQFSLDVSYVADIILPITGIVNAISADVDIVEDMVYWGDDVAAGIYRAPLIGGPAQVVIKKQAVQPKSIAIDWIGRKIYWVDYLSQSIEVANLDGSSERILLTANQGVNMPRGLALDLKFTYLYWTDGENVKRMAMDGTMVTTLIMGQCEPTSITITDRWIVWTDPCFVSIGRADADTGVISRGGINAPNQLLYGVAVYNTTLYWVNRQDKSLHRATFDKSRTAASIGADESVLISALGIDVTEIRLIQKTSLAERDIFQHPCAQNRGCGGLCLPNQWSTVSQYTCACGTGIRLNPDGKTCPRIPTTFLLVVVAGTIVQISLDTPNLDMTVMVDGLVNPLAIDFLLTSSDSGQMFWVDPTDNVILTANLMGGPANTTIQFPGSPQGLAVDWIASNIYWIAQGSDQLPAGVYVARTDGSSVRAIATGGIVNPRSIAVHPIVGLVFWVDQTSRSRIHRCNLDGSNRTLIFNSTGVITDLIVDHSANKLYWVDSENHDVRMSDLEGANQRVVVPKPTNQQYLEQPYGLAKLGNQIFWTEWHTLSLYRAVQNGPVNLLLRQLVTFAYQPNNIAVVNPLRPGELTPLASPLPCSVNNGDCQELCLATNTTHRLCACSQNLTCNETFGTPQHLLPSVPRVSTYDTLLPSTSPSSVIPTVIPTSVVIGELINRNEDPLNVMLLGVNIVMSVVVLVVLTAIIIILIILVLRYREARRGNSPKLNKQKAIILDSNNRKVPFLINNTKECIPLKNINSQPQGNLNQFKEELEYYDTSSVKGPQRSAPSIPDNPPIKQKDVTDVSVEVQLESPDPCDSKTSDIEEVDSETKVSNNEAMVPTVTDQIACDSKLISEMERTKAVAGDDTQESGDGKQVPSTKESNSTDDTEGAKSCTGEESQPPLKPSILARPTTPLTATSSLPRTPRGGQKATLRFNLPSEPLSSNPSAPPPAIPPRSPRVPLTTPKENEPGKM